MTPCNGVTRPRRRRLLFLASVLFVLITTITAIQVLVIPNIRRLNLQLFGLSSFDYGFHGFYPTRSYVSFDYVSPAPEIARWSSKCNNEYTFLSLHGSSVDLDGPMILDPQGKLVWRTPLVSSAEDFRVQEYRGKKYLTFWHGTFIESHGRGSWSMLDSSYVHRFEIRPVGDFDGDLHDFLITKNNTALITIYDVKPADLSSIGGPESGFIYDNLFQEVDIATQELLFEWRMSDHVPLNTSFENLGVSGKDNEYAYDAYHINSIDKGDDGNFLLSARHLHSLIKVDGRTGEVLWTLGGKMNSFHDASGGRATDFAWQHDARLHDNNTITLLDNAAETFLDDPTHSRAMVIDLDEPNRVATLRRAYVHPTKLRSTSQGNMQVLPDTGNVFVGWGHCAAFTEFSPDGEVLCDTHLGPSNWFQLGWVFSYRAFKGSWVGKPNTMPTGVVVDNSVFVSWNGATEVTAWRLELWDGNDMDEMRFKHSHVVKKDDFETELELPADLPTPYFRVVALGSKGQVLGKTDVLGKEIPWSLRDLMASWTFLNSWSVVVSLVMITSSLLLLAYWGWYAYANRRAHSRQLCPCSEQYQLVSLTSSETPSCNEGAASEVTADTPTSSPSPIARPVYRYDDD